MNWANDGLIPAIIQDAESGRVLMLGYMNEESFKKTVATGKVTFFSRSRKSLWVKGETSGNYLNVVEVKADCDQDALLIRARPEGPTCHNGTESCFDRQFEARRAEQGGGGVAGGEALPYSASEIAGCDFADEPHAFLAELEGVIAERFERQAADSYVAKLASAGLDRVAQKVGEEAVETVIAAKNDDLSKFEGEAADLLFHLMVLLRKKDSSLRKICAVLEERHAKAKKTPS